MTAGLATINYLKKNKNNVYSKINRLGDNARKGLAKIFSEAKTDIEVTGIGSLFLTHFLSDKVTKIRNAVDVAMSNQELLRKYHMALLAKHGIFFLPLKMGAFSEAHNDDDLKELFSATSSIIDSGIFS
jgi:glutamate-1-semialdehyde 2,1-aminomutase